MMHDVYLLPEDREYAEQRVLQLEKDIQDLGADFNDAFTQSSETWHDNSPFEAVRDKQSMMAAELDKLRGLIRAASITPPKAKRQTVTVGSLVTLSNGMRYKIAGDWTAQAGEQQAGIYTISRLTPIAMTLIGKKIGQEVVVRDSATTIEAVDV